MCKKFIYEKNSDKILKTKSNDLIVIQNKNNVDKNNFLKTIIDSKVATLYFSLKYYR